jgi:hypothetical protein
VTARDGAGLFPRLRRCGERGQQRGSVQPAPDVDFGQLGRQFVTVALDEATDGGDARAARVRGGCSVEDRRDRLLLGEVDETAGVDDQELGAVGSRRAMPGGTEPRLEGVGVGFVLGAAEGVDEERAAREGTPAQR